MKSSCFVIALQLNANGTNEYCGGLQMSGVITRRCMLAVVTSSRGVVTDEKRYDTSRRLLIAATGS